MVCVYVYVHIYISFDHAANLQCRTNIFWMNCLVLGDLRRIALELLEQMSSWLVFFSFAISTILCYLKDPRVNF